MAYAVFGSRAQTGTHVLQIVGVGAAGNHRQARFGSNHGQNVVELVLAVVAPVRVVGQVRRILGFVGPDRSVPDTHLIGHGPGVLGLTGGQRRRYRRHRQGAIAQRLGSDRGDQGRVRAAREGHQHSVHPSQQVVELFQLGGGLEHGRDCRTTRKTTRRKARIETVRAFHSERGAPRVFRSSRREGLPELVAVM